MTPEPVTFADEDHFVTHTDPKVKNFNAQDNDIALIISLQQGKEAKQNNNFTITILHQCIQHTMEQNRQS